MVTVNGALCSGQFAMSLMQTFFMFYYVKVFLNIFKVDEFWFGAAQILFVIWNAINDPLFGYMQDVSSTWLRRRTKVISFLGPFLAASFLVLWFPWDSNVTPTSYIVGCHLIIGLFLYDAFYSCINVAWSALFAETTSSRSERISAVKYSQFAILLSTNVVPITEKLTAGLDDFFAFQCIAVIIAVLAIFCFKLTGSLKYPVRLMNGESPSSTLYSDNFKEKFSHALETTMQILTKRDFQTIVFTYFLHTCRSTAHLNFAAIAIEILIPEHVLAKGSWNMSLFYAACTLIPQLLVILSGDVIVKIGTASVLIKSFVASMVTSALLLLFGHNKTAFIILFMLLDNIAVHSIAPLYQILLADYIDEDASYFSRQKPISTTIYSLAALLIRPAQSIAPFIIVMILVRYGYKEYQLSNTTSAQLTSCMFYVLCLATFSISTLQLLIFYPFATKCSVRYNKVNSFV